MKICEREQTEHVLRTRTEGPAAYFLWDCAPNPAETTTSKTYLVRVGVVEPLWLTIETRGNRAERHSERAAEV